MAATTDAQQKLTVPGKQDENVFTAWKNRKESQNPPTTKENPGAGGRRRSNLKDLAVSNMKGVAGLRRMTLTMRAKSDVSAEQLKPQIRKENTYKMKPDGGTEFSVAKVTKVVRQLLEEECNDIEYDHDDSSKHACMLAEKIKDKVKALNFPRYKIAANVMLGQVSDQGMEIASRCCWDHTTDNYACISYKSKSLFVIALVYGVYFE